MSTTFFAYPFAIAGTLQAGGIPNAGSPNAPVNYQYGWGAYYQLQLGVDPNAVPISRAAMNQLFFDITLALQQYQSVGTPDFISPSQTTNGLAYPYNIFARVRYPAGDGGLIYENQVDNNIATPGTDETWLKINSSANGIQPGTIIDWASPIVPAGYFPCDGTTRSRATFPDLFSNITFVQSGTISGGTTVSGLTNTQSTMYVGMSLEGVGIPAGTTVATIPTNTSITLSLASTNGVTSINFFPWGNGDGSTTYTLPDLQRQVTVGMGGIAINTAAQNPGFVVAQFGGEDAHVQTGLELATHTHTSNILGEDAAGASGIFVRSTNVNDHSLPVNVANAGSSAAANIMQQSTIVNKIIKF